MRGGGLRSMFFLVWFRIKAALACPKVQLLNAMQFVAEIFDRLK